MTPQHFDVIIMGGGPAGATLAALLRKEGALSVAVLESERFPRPHIGESFSHRLIPIMAESGALPKVMASNCWERKYGGYYAWDPQRPYATFFEHAASREDGIRRWAIHVNRAEFDQILLEHAESLGATVVQNCKVSRVDVGDDRTTVHAGEGQRFTCRLFVEASGRGRSMVGPSRKAFLSDYKNVAIWQHIVGGAPAQSLPGDWNIFREENLSAIGSFAFPDGWFWYIPVPMEVDGRRVTTHSLGVVTDPALLSERGVDLRAPGALLEQARQVPLLRDLVAEARPVYEKTNTATNYSMISERFCDFDERWILVGDSAHFVDPLFSSGVTFAMLYAASASLLIRCTFDEELDERAKRELWHDYHQDWNITARSFALGIDQWYHAIAKAHPGSVYWGKRAAEAMNDDRDMTFHALVNTEFSPDLLRVISRETEDIGQLDRGGAFAKKVESIEEASGGHNGTPLQLAEDVVLRDGLAIEVIRATVAAQHQDRDDRASRFWADHAGTNTLGAPIYSRPLACKRIVRSGTGGEFSIKVRDGVDGAAELLRLLRSGQHPEADLRARLTPHQQLLFSRMARAGMVVSSSNSMR